MSVLFLWVSPTKVKFAIMVYVYLSVGSVKYVVKIFEILDVSFTRNQ